MIVLQPWSGSRIPFLEELYLPFCCKQSRFFKCSRCCSFLSSPMAIHHHSWRKLQCLIPKLDPSSSSYTNHDSNFHFVKTKKLWNTTESSEVGTPSSRINYRQSFAIVSLGWHLSVFSETPKVTDFTYFHIKYCSFYAGGSICIPPPSISYHPGKGSTPIPFFSCSHRLWLLKMASFGPFSSGNAISSVFPCCYSGALNTFLSLTDAHK